MAATAVVFDGCAMSVRGACELGSESFKELDASAKGDESLKVVDKIGS